MFRRKHIVAAVAWVMALPGMAAAEPQSLQGDYLRPGARLTRQLEGPAVDHLRVKLGAGQFVKIVVMQSGTDVVVTFRDPDGRAMVETDSPLGAFGPETITAIATGAGDYTLETKIGSAAVAKGSYAVSLKEEREAAAADQELVSAHQHLNEAQGLRRQHNPAARQAAFELLGPVRKYFAASGDSYYAGVALLTEGAMRAEGGDIRGALANQEEAALEFQKAGDWRGEEVTRNNIGGMLDVLGDPQKALDAYRRSRALARENADHVHEAIVLNNIGKIEADFGNWQSALDTYKQALPLVRSAGDIRREALLLHNTARALQALGERKQAIELYEQALAVYRTTKEKRGQADALKAMAIVYQLERDPAQAVKDLEESLALYLELGDQRNEAECRMFLGRTYAGTGDLVKAREFLDETLVLEGKVQDRRTTALATLDASMVDALEKRPGEAISRAEKALAEFRAIGDQNSEAKALEAVARAESDRGNVAEARRNIEQALTLIETTRGRTDGQQLRASFFATQQDSYGFYIDLLMRTGDRAAALEASERSHARSLLEMLAEAGEIREGVDPKLLNREHEISNLLNAKGSRLLALMGRETPQAVELKKEVSALEAEYQDVQAALRKSSPRYATLTQPSPLKVGQIQTELLDADSLVLEYALGEKRSFLWAVSRDGLEAWELPAREQIEAQVGRVSELLTARSAAPRMETPGERLKRIEEADAALPGAARRLSEMVLGPAATALKGKRLAIVPDGGLQRVPFAMLPIPGSSEPLVTAHETVVLPSASALGALRHEVAGRAPAPKMLAVFADPVFDAADPRVGRMGGLTAKSTPETSRILEHGAPAAGANSVGPKIPRLPYTLQEAEQILRVAHDPSNLRATGFAANRAAATSAQLGEYRYLHFATHGYLDTERPSLSALVLSQIDEKRRPQDGFLRVNDIYNARLSADLVVLSACQTGLGQEVRGEGLMGLTRAFLYAGAPRVVVSLWNVNDRATAGLMASLYRGMLVEGKRPAAALREAQLEMRKQKRWESPYYWAAFEQHGEWK